MLLSMVILCPPVHRLLWTTQTDHAIVFIFASRLFAGRADASRYTDEADIPMRSIAKLFRRIFLKSSLIEELAPISGLQLLNGIVRGRISATTFVCWD